MHWRGQPTINPFVLSRSRPSLPQKHPSRQGRWSAASWCAPRRKRPQTPHSGLPSNWAVSRMSTESQEQKGSEGEKKTEREQKIKEYESVIGLMQDTGQAVWVINGTYVLAL